MVLFRRFFIIPLLIFEIALGPIASTLNPRTAQAQDIPQQNDPLSPEVIHQQKAVESITQGLENAEVDQYPTQSQKDAFKIGRQTLKTKAGRAYELSRLNTGLPNVPVVNFDQDVSVEIIDGVLTFALNRKGQWIASQTIEGLEATALARDKEILIVLDAQGTLHAIDMVYARSALFKGPIPLFQLKSAELSGVDPSSIQIEYLTRQSQVPAEASHVPQDRVWTAGDVLIRNSATLLEILPRDVVQNQIYVGEAVLSALAFAASPDDQTAEVSSLVLALQRNASVLEESRKALASSQDPWFSQALSAFTTEEIQNLIARSLVTADSQNKLKDRFTLQEWKSNFQQAVDQVTNEAPHRRLKTLNQAELLHSQLQPNKLRRVAAWTIGTASAACIATYCAVNAMADPQGVAWATHLINHVYNDYFPAVLKDQSYRWTLLKSSISLMALIPFTWAANTIMAKMSSKEDWNFKRQLASLGMKVYAAIQLPFFHRIASLAKQPNFIKSMQLGINPFGNGLVGLNNPFGNSDQREQAVQDKARTLEKIKNARNRKHAMAWRLALVAVSKKSGIDPVTLTLVSENRELLAGQLETLLADPKRVAEWTQTAEELYFKIDEADAISQDLNPELIQKYYQLASETAQQIQTRGKLAAAVTQLKLKWKKFGKDSLRFISGFGVDEYNFLTTVEPSQFIADQCWKQFTVDYALAVIQMGVMGARADITKPHDLAADPHGLLWTNPGHLTDMIDQVRIYAINVPASYALIYMRAKAITETAYEPIEYQTLVSKSTNEGFLKGLWKWTKGAVNLESANYGGLWMRDLVKKIKTIQANLLMAISARMLLGNQAFGNALAGFTLTMIWANWQYAWIWQPINRGNQIYEEEREALNQTFMDAKTRISQGLAVRDDAMLAEGYNKLQAMYASEKLPAGLLDGVEEISTLRSNAQTLLEHSLENAPFSQKNSKVEWVTTWFGALSTTYLYSALSTLSFQTHKPWIPLLAETALVSAALYAGTYYGQKLINKTAVKLRKMRKNNVGIFGLSNKFQTKCSKLLSRQK